MTINLTKDPEQLRTDLFAAIVAELDAARAQGEGITVRDRTATRFSVVRNGHTLIVSYGRGQKFIEAKLVWRDTGDSDPDAAQELNVSLAAGTPPRLAITPNGIEGSSDDVIDYIVRRTFLAHTSS